MVFHLVLKFFNRQFNRLPPKSVASSRNPRIFKCLNCPLCDKPYSRKIDGDKPKRLPLQTGCLEMQAMCEKCFKKQIELKETKRVHQCEAKACFTWSYNVIELLSSGCVTLDKSKKGYVRTGNPIKVPECPACHQKCGLCPFQRTLSLQYKKMKPKQNIKYSLEAIQSQLFPLRYGHNLCYACSHQRLKETSGSITCPQCEKCSSYDYVYGPRKSLLKAFLQEFKERELLEIDMKRACCDCGNKSSLLDMYQCSDCEKKILCSLCVCKQHRQHQVLELEKEEIKKMAEETRETIIPQIKAHDVSFPELRSDLITNINSFKEEFINQLTQLDQLKNYESAKEKQGKCLSISDQFEGISKKFLADLKAYNTGIEKLTSGLKGVEVDLDNGIQSKS